MKICIMHICVKGPVSRIYKELLLRWQITQKDGHNVWTFNKSICKMTRTDMNKWSTLSVIREMRTKSTMRYHYTPIRIAKTIHIYNHILEELRITRTLKHCWWDGEMYKDFGKVFVFSQVKQTFTTWASNSVPRYIPAK